MIGGIAGALALFLLVSYVVMRLWNWLVPSKFNGPTLRFSHAAGLLLLSKILLGGFGGGRGWGGPHRYAQRDWTGDRDRCHERFEQTPPPQPAAPPGGDSTPSGQ